MLLNLRSSVNWRHNTVAYLCGVGLFLLMSSAAAQDTTLIYQVGASEGVWTERTQARSIPVETGQDTISPYQPQESAMPAYDSATARQQYEPSFETQSEAYQEAYGDAYGETYGDAYGETYGDAYGTYETYDSRPHEPAARYSVVKNRDFFGVDRDRCCDEWSKFANVKDLKYKSNCGGLKANKGHLGISWLRSADNGEDCDYCQGGCCERGVRAASRQNRETRRDVFTSAWNKAPRRRGDNCSLGNCPEEEGCTSCR